MRPGLTRVLAMVAVLTLCLGRNGVAQTAGASDAEKVAVIRQILELTRAADQVMSAIETSVPMQRAANPRVPAVFWDRFLAAARARRGEFVDSLVPLYNQSFDLADLKAMLQLYQSPFGQRLLQVQPKLAQESMVLGQRWGMRLGAEIGQQLEAEGVRIQP